MEIRIEGGRDLARIAKELRAVGEVELRKKMVRDLRAAAKPAVGRVRRAIAAIPSHHDGTLRGEMKRATKLTVRSTGSQAGIVIRVDGRKMPEGKGSLPSVMDGRKRWRHPVFGNTDAWVSQAAHPFFDKAVEPTKAEFAAAMKATSEEIARAVT